MAGVPFRTIPAAKCGWTTSGSVTVLGQACHSALFRLQSGVGRLLGFHGAQEVINRIQMRPQVELIPCRFPAAKWGLGHFGSLLQSQSWTTFPKRNHKVTTCSSRQSCDTALFLLQSGGMPLRNIAGVPSVTKQSREQKHKCRSVRVLHQTGLA